MSLRKKLRKIQGFDGLSRIGPALRSRWRIRRRLKRFAPLMAPGRYLLQWNLACRELAPGESPSVIRATFVTHNHDPHPVYRLVECLPPRRHSIPADIGASDDASAGDVLLMRGYATLILTRDGHHIIRTFETAERAQNLVDNAAHLRHWLRVPAIEPFDSGLPGIHAVRESLIAGTMIRHGDSGENARGYRDFIGQCQAHAQAASGRFAREADIDRLLASSLPRWLAAALAANAAAIKEILADAPMLFSHGDCHPGNLIVQSDGTAALIDLERAEWLPFFFDPLYILRMQDPACADLRERYLAGEFDEPLGHVWRAAGRAFDPEQRVNYLLCVSIAHALRRQYADKGTQEQVRKLGNSSRALKACLAPDSA